ncbi:S8 family serine peptidase [Mammaliicoccus sp. Dog046]|uniref:S8 family serine peptidase n=1 Tax=Mammaliicoccus sp. Dog046 TaxID=3034233 RepID=UPI002B258CE0|nr:S8 family serine peptidase [Mammaliicoccus sp. Dog046]WQK84944.1 S8 family serine peptidase [Mammaliicoccus sp. Dog046]
MYIIISTMMLICYFIYYNHSNKFIKVAVLDTGIDSKLIRSKVISKNFLHISKHKNMHGTNIAKKIENQNKIIIYDAEVLNNNGNGTIEDTIDGIDWAIKNKVHIINMSYGFTHNYKDLQEKITEARSKGIIIVTANGNDIFGQK